MKHDSYQNHFYQSLKQQIFIRILNKVFDFGNKIKHSIISMVYNDKVICVDSLNLYCKVDIHKAKLNKH